MTLAQWQHQFRAEIAAADDGLPPSSTGMAIYRNAYRARLEQALETSFELTRKWVGEESFAAAAAHYILTSPPRSWTLDAFGLGFPALLEELFANDGEVAELAWLEWAMQQAFAAADRPALDLAGLAAAGLSPADWDAQRFAMAPGFAAREVETACTALWQALADGNAQDFDPAAPGPKWLIVWRSGYFPRYRLLDADEFAVLDALAAGHPLGEALTRGDPQRLGPWLAGWLEQGLFSPLPAR